MKRIALVGTAPSGVHAPFDDPSWQIWGVGMRADYVTRADRWFELHRLAGHPPDWTENWRKHLRLWAKDSEIVMLYPEPDLGPRITAYPHERIAERFGTYFMTSSFSWMMADAIDQMCPAGGRKRPGVIGLWGVDMEYGTEYRRQRVGLRHFIDLARVLGIKVTRLASSGIAYEPVPYPLIQDDPMLQKIALRRQAASDDLTGMRAALADAQQMTTEARGALAELEKFTNGSYEPELRGAELRKQIGSFARTADKIAHDITHLEGQDAAHAWMDDYLQP